MKDLASQVPVKEEMTPVGQAAVERWTRMERRMDDWILGIVVDDYD